ncbi:MAG: hypothetical protein KGD63_13915, partial [Candidatus Lokiarchaeota archaeon]|nr:hypothetical protein [Candidatus Lokiarchaeota archaeon]
MMGKTKKIGKLKKILLESEYDNSKAWENMQEIKRMTYGMKCFILIACLIIFMSSFSGLMTVVAGTPETIEYTFEDNVLYDSTLENVNYTETNLRNQSLYTGNYPATYSFENGSDSFIDIISVDDNCFYEVIDFLDGHDSVLELSDYNNTDNIVITNEIIPQILGTYEFWIQINSSDRFDYRTLGDTAQYCAYFYFDHGDVFFYDGSSIDIGNYELNAWYHYKINFDCSTDIYAVYQNNILLKSDCDYLSLGLTINSFQISTHSTDNNYRIYLDGIGYSWDKTDLEIDETYYVDSVDMYYGTKSGIISNAQNDDESYFLLTSEWVEIAEAYYVQTENLGFTADPNGRYAYFSYDIVSSLPNVKINVDDVNWKTGSPSLDADNQLHSGVNDVYIWAGSASAFTIRVYYFKLVSSTYIYHYEIGDNLIPEVNISQIIKEIDKWDFDYTENGVYTEIDQEIPFWTEVNGSNTYLGNELIQNGEVIIESASIWDVGFYKDDFSVLDGFVNITWNMYYDYMKVVDGVFYVNIYSQDSNL